MPPPTPANVLLNMRAHRIKSHNTASILGWVEDCAACEEMEADYAASLEYYYRAANEQIADDAKRRWIYETAVSGRASSGQDANPKGSDNGRL